ncbi:MAG: hypothetical protein NC191_04815 [Muribaculaceae bacterium]|nr:hypothetical protein [Muribaculaceae bacterium]
MDTELFAGLLIVFILGATLGWFGTMLGYESYCYNIPMSQIKGQYLQLPNGTLWKKQ